MDGISSLSVRRVTVSLIYPDFNPVLIVYVMIGITAGENKLIFHLNLVLEYYFKSIFACILSNIFPTSPRNVVLVYMK